MGSTVDKPARTRVPGGQGASDCKKCSQSKKNLRKSGPSERGAKHAGDNNDEGYTNAHDACVRHGVETESHAKQQDSLPKQPKNYRERDRTSAAKVQEERGEVTDSITYTELLIIK